MSLTGSEPSPELNFKHATSLATQVVDGFNKGCTANYIRLMNDPCSLSNVFISLGKRQQERVKKSHDLFYFLWVKVPKTRTLLDIRTVNLQKRNQNVVCWNKVTDNKLSAPQVTWNTRFARQQTSPSKVQWNFKLGLSASSCRCWAGPRREG